jgi:hypothetical protein
VFGAKDLYAALQEAGVTRDDLQGRKYVDLRSAEVTAGFRTRGRDAAARWPS